MKTVQVRNVIIGEGRPKICVPIVGQTKEEILTEAGSFAEFPIDVVEWRADWYEDVFANVLLSVGTPGIPGGAIASFAALATMAGLPAGVMGVYISINTLCDMGATCVNVIGDMAGCVVLQEKIKLEEN